MLNVDWVLNIDSGGKCLPVCPSIEVIVSQHLCLSDNVSSQEGLASLTVLCSPLRVVYNGIGDTTNFSTQCQRGLDPGESRRPVSDSGA